MPTKSNLIAYDWQFGKVTGDSSTATNWNKVIYGIDPSDNNDADGDRDDIPRESKKASLDTNTADLHAERSIWRLTLNELYKMYGNSKDVRTEIDLLKLHESQRTGQCRLICVPAKLLRVQPDARYGLLRPHSSGSPAPLHTPVVVVVVAVVDAKQESHPARRPEIDHNYGTPVDACAETHLGSGIFTRSWTNADVTVDCNAWTGKIEPRVQV